MRVPHTPVFESSTDIFIWSFFLISSSVIQISGEITIFLTGFESVDNLTLKIYTAP
jgi:hypothetical protein